MTPLNSIRQYLGIDLDSDNKFISVKQGNEKWEIKTKKTSECQNLQKTTASQKLIFESLIRKLRAEPLKSGITSENMREWKINQKVNVLFSEILIRNNGLAGLESARLEVAEALESHLKTHILNAEANPGIPEIESLKKKPQGTLSGSLPSYSHNRATSDTAAKEKKVIAMSRRTSKKSHRSAPTILLHTQANSAPELFKHELILESLKNLTVKELISCLFAFQATDKKKGETVDLFEFLKKQMASDPLSESEFNKLREMGLFLNPLLVGPAILQMLNFALKGHYSPHNMCEDYLRQLPRVEVSGTRGVTLWKFSETKKSEEADEEEQFEQTALQFRLFLKTLLKKGCKSSGPQFCESKLGSWDKIVEELKADREKKEDLFATALENFWKLMIENTQDARQNEISLDQLQINPGTFRFVSLLSGSRQALYVGPVTNLMFLFPEFNIKITNRPYCIKYKFEDATKVSIETSKTLLLDNQKYDFIDFLNIEIEASSSLTEPHQWKTAFSIEVVPKPNADTSLLLHFVQLLKSRGLNISIKQS